VDSHAASLACFVAWTSRDRCRRPLAS